MIWPLDLTRDNRFMNEMSRHPNTNPQATQLISRHAHMTAATARK
jgi:hypothetical protein